MKKHIGRIIRRRIFKGLKILAISALGCLVALCSPQAVCHVLAAGPVRFTTYLMLDENGEFATDSRGDYIQLLDEKGNLLAYNDDVRRYLKDHADEDGNGLAAKEKEFFLIGGKLYLDESGSMELTDLSKVMPALFKYGGIESGYTLESDRGAIYIAPLDVQGRPVYVAKIAGDYEKLPAFTISSDGEIGYFERDSVSGGSGEVDFVYDSNYYYDENLVQILNMGEVVPEAGSEDEPMFAGYFVKSGSDRRQFIDIDGSVVLPAGEYRDMKSSGAVIEAEYCYVIGLYADGAELKNIYSDVDGEALYHDYQQTDSFDNIGDDILSQLSYDNGPARGHFAGFYAQGGEEGSLVRFIDESGNASDTSEGAGNRDYYARFYHIITADGSENGGSVYFSDGKAFSDPELMTGISNIADVTGSIPEDSSEKVHSDKKDMDGISTRYFVGYYFATDFWEDGEEDTHREILASEYEEEGFDPAEVEINKIQFADRDGNIVFDPDNAPEISEDMTVYENWYTVTVWDDGEVEVEDKADETAGDKEAVEEDTEEKKEGEEASEENPDESEDKKDGQDGEDKEKPEGEEGKTPEGDGTDIDKGSEDPAAVQPGSDGSENGDDNNDSEEKKEGIEENAKPSDKEQGNDDESDAGDAGNSGDGGDGDNTGKGGDSGNAGGNVDMIMSVPKPDEEGEG